MTWANDNPDPDPWGRAFEIRQGALAASDGDTTAAFILLSIKTRDVTDGANVLQGDLKACELANQRFKDYYSFDDKTWLRNAWDSDVVKVGLFIGGIWLGTRIVDNVN